MPRARYLPVPMSQINEPPEPLRGSHDPDKLKELAASLREHGQLQPILLVPSGEGFTIVAGHRRFLAARLLGWDKIEAKVLPSTLATWEIAALAENVHRENLTPVEEARVIFKLVVTEERDVDAVATQFGKSRAWVDHRLDLCQYPHDLLDAVHKRDVSLAAAAHLARVTDDGYRAYLLDAARNNGCTERLARSWADDWEAAHARQGEPTTAADTSATPYHGQGVGLECAGCSKLYAVASLRPLHYCPECLTKHFEAKKHP